jgi:hypothetical protein
MLEVWKSKFIQKKEFFSLLLSDCISGQLFEIHRILADNVWSLLRNDRYDRNADFLML